MFYTTGTVTQSDLNFANAQVADPPVATPTTATAGVTTTSLIVSGVISVISSTVIATAIIMFVHRRERYYNSVINYCSVFFLYLYGLGRKAPGF